MSIIDLAAILLTALPLYVVGPVKENIHARALLYTHTQQMWKHKKVL